MKDAVAAAARERDRVRKILLLAAFGCVLPAGASAAVPARLTVDVVDANSTGTVLFNDIDIETDYLPNVVQAENGAASFEALKAQAVAARTFLYYKLESQGYIRNGQADQVYEANASSPNAPSAAHVAAAAVTEREILRFDNVTIAGFYVAGLRPATTGAAPFGVAEPAIDSAGHSGTEQYVTYNRNLTRDAIDQTSLGFQTTPPSNFPRNRGGMSQNGADFLSDNAWDYLDILRYYYGADIRLEMATTPSTGPRAANVKTLASFEVAGPNGSPTAFNTTYDAGIFNSSSRTASGSNRNLTSLAVQSAPGANGSRFGQQITINYDETNPDRDRVGYRLRYISGLGPNTAPAVGADAQRATAVTNLSIETTGSVGLWLKATSTALNPALRVSIVLDDLNGATNETEQGRSQLVVTDGTWRKYEWFLDAPAGSSEWLNFFAGDGKVDGELFSLDSILFEGLADATVTIDDVFYNPDGTAPIPEPAGLLALAVALPCSAAAARPSGVRRIDRPQTRRPNSLFNVVRCCSTASPRRRGGLRGDGPWRWLRGGGQGRAGPSRDGLRGGLRGGGRDGGRGMCQFAVARGQPPQRPEAEEHQDEHDRRTRRSCREPERVDGDRPLGASSRYITFTTRR